MYSVSEELRGSGGLPPFLLTLMIQAIFCYLKHFSMHLFGDADTHLSLPQGTLWILMRENNDRRTEIAFDMANNS